MRKTILPLLISTLLLSACSAERGNESTSVTPVPEDDPLAVVQKIDPEPGTEQEAETPELNEEPEHPDYLAYFRERSEEIGFEFFDVAHLYSEPGLLSAGMAEKDGSSIYLFLLDSPEKAADKAKALKESFGDAEGMDKPVATTTMNGSRYLIAVKGNECYMVICDESEPVEEMAEWIEVDLKYGEETSEKENVEALEETDSEGDASVADAGQSEPEAGNGSDGEPAGESGEAADGDEGKNDD